MQDLNKDMLNEQLKQASAAMSDLAHLLHQYLASRDLSPAVRDGHGGLNFHAGADLVVRASMTDEEGLELCVNPGYLSQAQLDALAEEENAQDDDDPGWLMDWKSAGALWRLRANVSCGLVMLSQTRPACRRTPMPWTVRLKACAKPPPSGLPGSISSRCTRLLKPRTSETAMRECVSKTFERKNAQ